MVIMIIRSSFIQNGMKDRKGFLKLSMLWLFYLISFKDSAEECQIFIT